MEIELPTTMHIANGSQTRSVACVTPSSNGVQFYAWSAQEGTDRWRTEFRLVGTKLIESNNSNSFRNYVLLDYECLQQGDLVYKPELQVYFPVMSIFIFMFILAVIYKMLIKRLMP